jgi:hypothetical protein
MASGGGPLQRIRRRATDQGPNTRGTARYRQEIIERLEQPLALRDQASEPVVDYLVVLDEARGLDWTGLRVSYVGRWKYRI